MIFCDTWNLCESHIVLLINKVLLEYHHPQSFMYSLWLLSCYNERELSWVVVIETLWPRKQNIYYLALQKKKNQPPGHVDGSSIAGFGISTCSTFSCRDKTVQKWKVVTIYTLSSSGWNYLLLFILANIWLAYFQRV